MGKTVRRDSEYSEKKTQPIGKKKRNTSLEDTAHNIRDKRVQNKRVNRIWPIVDERNHGTRKV